MNGGQRTDGKAIAVENGGQPWTVTVKRQAITVSVEFARATDFLDLTVEPVSGQAPWSRGQVLVVADVAALSAGSVVPDWYYAEVEVLGEIGNMLTIIARLGFGPGKQAALVPIDRPFERILFQSKLAVSNGEGNVTPQSIGFSAVGRFYR